MSCVVDRDYVETSRLCRTSRFMTQLLLFMFEHWHERMKLLYVAKGRYTANKWKLSVTCEKAAKNPRFSRRNLFRFEEKLLYSNFSLFLRRCEIEDPAFSRNCFLRDKNKKKNPDKLSATRGSEEIRGFLFKKLRSTRN